MTAHAGLSWTGYGLCILRNLEKMALYWNVALVFLITGLDLKRNGGAFVKWGELENTANGRDGVERSANEIHFKDISPFWWHGE